MFIASLSACLEYDSKKIIAYSTLRQLGLMIISISLGLVNFAFFHLLTHAVFKALLFITRGYKILSSSHFQDRRILKFSFYSKFYKNFIMQICILSLIGFPFLAGFFSKDSVIEGRFWIWKKFFFFSFFVCLPLTSFYGFRLLFKTSNIVWLNPMGRQKINLSFYSLIYLFILTIFTGSHFSKVNSFLNYKIVSSFSEKLSVLLLILFGFLVSTKIEKKSRFIFVSELGFLNTFKGSFFLKFCSENIFFIFKTLDFGLKKRFINFVKTVIENFSQFLKELSLFFKNLKNKILKILFGLILVLLISY